MSAAMQNSDSNVKNTESTGLIIPSENGGAIAYQSASDIRQFIPEIADQYNYHQIIGAMKRIVKDRRTSIADLETQAAIAETLPEAMDRGEVTTEHGGSKYTFSTVENVAVSCSVIDRFRKVAAIPEELRQKYYSDTESEGQRPTRNGLFKWHRSKVIESSEANFDITPVVSHASWDDWLPKQECCDLLLTDPPYSTDVDDVWGFAADWLPVALGKVKPTGSAFVCIGAYPDEIAAYLAADRAGMNLLNILVWTYRNTLGPSPSDRYKLNWQAVLFFRGPQASDLNCPKMTEQFAVQDIAAPDGRHGNRDHEWQKPDDLADRFIRHCTVPGDTVLDPFVCTGTFVLSAGRLGRRGLGCDIDSEHLKIAKRRGCKIAK